MVSPSKTNKGKKNNRNIDCFHKNKTNLIQSLAESCKNYFFNLVKLKMTVTNKPLDKGEKNYSLTSLMQFFRKYGTSHLIQV